MVPLLLAKISIPHRAKPLVRRERLLRLLHDNVQRRLTLISSGAGYGKTALLVDYAHDTTLPVCWYSLDESDADLSVFVAYLVASLGQRFPAIGSTALDELVADSNLDNRPGSLARLLLDVIERQTDGLFCLVLDDLHHVLCSPEIVEFLNTFIRFKTDRCSLIISSREVPQGLSLAYWRAYGEVLVLDAALCFDGDETIALARLRQSGLSHAELAWLTEQSQGWVTAILLMMDSWRGSGVPRSVPAKETIQAFLETEVLAAQPERIVDLLLDWSVPEVLTPALCSRLSDHSDSGSLLQELAARHLLIDQIDLQQSAYRFHDLWRELLQTKLQETDPERYQHLRVCLAEYMRQQGDLHGATDQYVAAGAYEEAAQLAEMAAYSLFRTGEWAEIERWVDDLPDLVLQGHPRLLLYIAKVDTEHTEFARALLRLDLALRAYRRYGDLIGEARVLTQIAVVHRLCGSLDEALACARQAMDMPAVQDPLVDILAGREIGICEVMRGNYDVGLTELAQALGIARRQGDVVNATIISADIGNAYLERGELEQARSQLGQALIGYHKVGMPGPLISVLQGLGMVNHYLGRYAQAEGYLLDALDQATKAGDERLRAYALANLGELERETNRLSSALDHLVEAVLLARERDLSQLELFVIMALGDVCRRQGDRERAHDWLRQALHHHYAPTCRREVAEAWLAMGALQRDWGLLVESGQSLACALDMAIDTGHQRLQG